MWAQTACHVMCVVVLLGCASDANWLDESRAVDSASATLTGACLVEPGDELVLELPTWNLQLSDADWDLLHVDVRADVEVPATVCIEGTSYAIEVELQGSSTRKLPKKSFDLKFKRSQPLRSWPYDAVLPDYPVAIDKVFIKAMAKDQSMVREALGFDLYRALGYATPHTGFINLRINGAYWGVYATIEPVNKAYLAAHGYAEGGRLYKATREHGSRADFAPGRDLMLAFETDLDGQGMPTEANDDVDEYAGLRGFVHRLQTTQLEQSAFDSQINSIFPLQAYFDRMLWVAFTQNGDAIAQNYFLYFSEYCGTEHWEQLPWDSDISFGANYRNVEAVIDTALSPLVDGGNYFSRRMLEVPLLRERYKARFASVLDEQLLEAEGLARLSIYRERLTNDLEHNQFRWGRTTDAKTAFDRIETFIQDRGAVLRAALSAL